MYTSFFGLNEKPFSITPDPRYLFMSERHSEALAHLVYGVTESGGFLQLTGEVGTGKTTLIRSLLISRMPDNANVAVVLNSQITSQEFLLTICEELNIAAPKNSNSIKALTDALNKYLLKAHACGRKTILIIDEAQNLTPIVLEQIRLLTNLETAKQKLLQIILIGQPELRELLKRNDLRQLAQRVTGRYHLEPLSKEETFQYIKHRFSVAGALGEIMGNRAKKEVFFLSKGIPRLINVICDRALLGAYSLDQRIITKKIIRCAADEIAGELKNKANFPTVPIIIGLFTIIITIITYFYIDKLSSDSTFSGNISDPIFEIEKPIIKTENPKPLRLVERLSLNHESTTKHSAMTTLFNLWGLTYKPETSDICLQAANAGLGCIYQRESWNGLSKLDRPAILKVIGVDGSPHELVLISINGDVANLSVRDVMVSHPIHEITDIWFGDFLMLWRPYGGISSSFSSRSTGPDVIWLKKSLAKINSKYLSKNTNDDSYDQNLKEIVKQFQQDNHLKIDGLVGQQTLIIINSLLGLTKSPRLSTIDIVQE